jgi:hypothetical protein
VAELVVFPAYALLVLEERLKEHQAEGTLDTNADVTSIALKILLLTYSAAGSPRSLAIQVRLDNQKQDTDRSGEQKQR